MFRCIINIPTTLIIVAVTVIALASTSFTNASSNTCGVIRFPNGSTVDLTNYKGKFEGKVSQTGSFPGQYTFVVSPCVATCGGSTFLSQVNEGVPCTAKIDGMSSAPAQDGPIIKAVYGPTTDSSSGLVWTAELRFLCGISSSLSVVGAQYFATVQSGNVQTYWTVMDAAFCAVAPSSTSAPGGSAPAPTTNDEVPGWMFGILGMLCFVILVLAFLLFATLRGGGGADNGSAAARTRFVNADDINGDGDDGGVAVQIGYTAAGRASGGSPRAATSSASSPPVRAALPASAPTRTAATATKAATKSAGKSAAAPSAAAAAASTAPAAKTAGSWFSGLAADVRNIADGAYTTLGLPYNAMCKPSCSGTRDMKCDQMSWCTVYKPSPWGPTCRPKCEAITNNDACWSTSGCWFYNGKCLPACRYYSDNESFCLSSPFGSYCTWDNDPSIAVDYESCTKIAGMSYSSVQWDFHAQKCGFACYAQYNQTTCNALGSQCQWYPNSATDGEKYGSCLDNCAVGTSETACMVLSGCYWLGGSCTRSCRTVPVFRTQDDPQRYDTSRCDALNYCGVTVYHGCRDKKCSAAQNRDECANLNQNCVYVAGSCIPSCSAVRDFPEFGCPTGNVNGITLCEWQFGWCQPAQCGNFTTLGRDDCYALGGDHGNCMFYQGKCQKACSSYARGQCNLNACAYNSSIGFCYLAGCNNAGQDVDAMLCNYGRYKGSRFYENCHYRLGKCYANSCSSATTKSSCMALAACAWVNNTYNFQGCIDSRFGLSYDQCWSSNFQFDTTKCACELSCSVQGAAGCGGMCSVDAFGLCSHSPAWMHNRTCSQLTTSATGATPSTPFTTHTSSSSPSSSSSSGSSPTKTTSSTYHVAGWMFGILGVLCFVIVVLTFLIVVAMRRRGNFAQHNNSLDASCYVSAVDIGGGSSQDAAADDELRALRSGCGAVATPSSSDSSSIRKPTSASSPPVRAALPASAPTRTAATATKAATKSAGKSAAAPSAAAAAASTATPAKPAGSWFSGLAADVKNAAKGAGDLLDQAKKLKDDVATGNFNAVAQDARNLAKTAKQESATAQAVTRDAAGAAKAAGVQSKALDRAVAQVNNAAGKVGKAAGTVQRGVAAGEKADAAAHRVVGEVEQLREEM